jgi:hypothetical protein
MAVVPSRTDTMRPRISMEFDADPAAQFLLPASVLRQGLGSQRSAATDADALNDNFPRAGPYDQHHRCRRCACFVPIALATHGSVMGNDREQCCGLICPETPPVVVHRHSGRWCCPISIWPALPMRTFATPIGWVLSLRPQDSTTPRSAASRTSRRH